MSLVPINRDWVYLGAGPIWRGSVQDRYPYSACMCLLGGSSVPSSAYVWGWSSRVLPVWGLHVFYPTARNQFHMWANHLSDLPVSHITEVDGWPLSQIPSCVIAAANGKGVRAGQLPGPVCWRF